jgi:hypothetical protein
VRLLCAGFLFALAFRTHPVAALIFQDILQDSAVGFDNPTRSNVRLIASNKDLSNPERAVAVGNRRREHRASVTSAPVARGDVVADMPPVPSQFWRPAMADNDGPEVTGTVRIPLPLRVIHVLDQQRLAYLPNTSSHDDRIAARALAP